MRREAVTRKRRAEVFRDNGGICHLCTRRVAPGEAWEVEHVKPVGLGGTDSPDNLKPAHVDCHKGKTRKDVKIMRKADRALKAHVLPSKSRRQIKSRGFQKWKPNVKQLEDL